MIRNEARLADKKGIQNFMGTEGWCLFYGLSVRTKTSIAQRMPADYEDKIVKFNKLVIHARKRTSFELG